MEGFEEDLAEKARTYGIDYFDAIRDDFLADCCAIPATWAMARCLLPARIDGRDILFMASPDDIEALEAASRAAGRAFEPALAPREAILDAIARKFAPTGAAGGSINAPSTGTQGAESPSRIPIPRGRAADSCPGAGPVTGPTAGAGSVPGVEPPGFASSGRAAADLLGDGGGAPATRFINAMLLRAISESASDVHVEPFAETTSVRFRIDGVLHPRDPVPRGLEQAVASRLKVMAGMDISERRLPQDGMAEVRIGGNSIDIRVSSIPVDAGERMVLRLLNREDAHLPLGRLGMAGGVLAAFRSLVASPNGIIVISGPTGSGKTTTLYAALGEIDSTRRNILTIEDPVEYRLKGVGQMQVKPKIGLTFASGLRHILRQDPDIILVGETRDAETAEIAVRASLTGHLVLTTLHTNDAPSAIVRLTDMGIPPYLVASSLRGVLAQRLARMLCPDCRAKAAPDPRDLARSFITDKWRERLKADGVFAAAGCGKCTEGRRGRTGVFELMPCTREVAALVRDGVSDAAALRHAAGDGFFSMADDALSKVAAGQIDLAEVAGAFV